MQNAVVKEVRRLLEEGPIETVYERKDDIFSHPTFISVKKYCSMKMTIDAKALKAIDKDKYQTPKLEILFEMLAERFESTGKKAKYGTLNLVYHMRTDRFHYLP